jgi:23S rRNA pseudouridine2604 synthase
MRLNKYIAQSGFCSRRQADQLIQSGDVLVNGEPAEMGQQVLSTDRIEVKGLRIGGAQQHVYLAYHKPVGIMCTTDTRKKDNIIEAVNYPQRVFPVGRLDVASSGLILLTNDGALVNRINKAENKLEKEYVVRVNLPITPAFLTAMAQGVEILGRKTLPARVTRVDDHTFRIVLIQGMHRQIRRMCQALGYRVKKLHRERVGKLQIGQLLVGEYKEIELTEVL